MATIAPNTVLDSVVCPTWLLSTILKPTQDRNEELDPLHLRAEAHPCREREGGS